MTVVKTVIDGLHRDTDTNALLSQDVNAFKMYKSTRKQNITLQSLHIQLQELKSEINSLKQQIKAGQ